MIDPQLERQRATLKRYDYPPSFIVEMTAYCNLQCTMCPQPQVTRRRAQMSFETWRRIVDDIAAHSPDSELWPAIMGEPLLLGDDFYTFVQYARESGLDNINLNTNLLLLEERDYERIMLLGLRSINVGLDAATAETYARIRQGGDFEVARRNMLGILGVAKRLGLQGPKIVAQLVEMEENIDEVDAFISYWTSKGAHVKLRRRLGWGKGVDAPYLAIKQTERFMPCPCLIRAMSIHWDGRVPQCDGDWNGEEYLGDVNKQSIKEIWDGELARRRERHWNGDFDFEPCRHCSDWQGGLAAWYNPAGQ